VRALLAAGETERAEALVRERLEATPPAERSSSWSLLLGEVLEAARRPAEAALHYGAVSGSSGGSEDAVAAWLGLARLRESADDLPGSVRALAKAVEFAGPDQRAAAVAALRRGASALGTLELNALLREGHGGARGFLLVEAASRDLSAERAREAVQKAREALEYPDAANRERASALLLQAERELGRAAPASIDVALLAPLTGRFANFGNAFLLGARIALEERTATAQPPVRLAVHDTEGDLLVAAQSARAAILENGCRTILGPLLSVPSIGAGAVAQSYGIPLVTPTATDPRLKEIGPYILDLAPQPAELARPLGEFSAVILGHRRHAVLVDRDPSSSALEAEFRSAVEAAGGEVTISLTFETGQRDFRRLLDHILESAVDAVYIAAGPADLKMLAPQLEFYEFECQILGNGGWTNPDVLDPGNLALEGAIFAVRRADDPESDFSYHLRNEVWMRTRGEVSRFHVHGYLAMASFLAALERGARDPAEILEVLRHRKYWDNRPAGERIELLTFRDGVLGPAHWAVGFDVKGFPSTPEEEEDTTEDETDEEQR
jgi:branched-chain amino acid transport system substrate-binding protein